MEESKRQKQVGALLNEELSDIFRRLGFGVVGKGMISITAVKVTPDLLEARIYLSFFQIDDKEEMLQKIKDRNWEIKNWRPGWASNCAVCLSFIISLTTPSITFTKWRTFSRRFTKTKRRRGETTKSRRPKFVVYRLPNLCLH